MEATLNKEKKKGMAEEKGVGWEENVPIPCNECIHGVYFQCSNKIHKTDKIENIDVLYKIQHSLYKIHITNYSVTLCCLYSF